MPCFSAVVVFLVGRGIYSIILFTCFAILFSHSHAAYPEWGILDVVGSHLPEARPDMVTKSVKAQASCAEGLEFNVMVMDRSIPTYWVGDQIAHFVTSRREGIAGIKLGW